MSAYNLKNAKISFSSSGDNTVISAVSGACVKVYGLFFSAVGATNITYKDGTTGLSDPIVIPAGGGDQLAIENEPWFYCVPGDGFVMNSSTATGVAGTIYYTQGG